MYVVCTRTAIQPFQSALWLKQDKTKSRMNAENKTICQEQEKG